MNDGNSHAGPQTAAGRHRKRLALVVVKSTSPDSHWRESALRKPCAQALVTIVPPVIS